MPSVLRRGGRGKAISFLRVFTPAVRGVLKRFSPIIPIFLCENIVNLVSFALTLAKGSASARSLFNIKVSEVKLSVIRDHPGNLNKHLYRLCLDYVTVVVLSKKKT